MNGYWQKRTVGGVSDESTCGGSHWASPTRTPGYENVGRRLTAFDGPDACPVGLIVSNVTCDVRLRENMVEHNGHVVALTRVTSRSRLKAGTYYIEEGGID